MAYAMDVITMAVAVAGLAASASAGTMVVDAADAQVRNTGVFGQQTNWTIRAGEQNAPGSGCAVFPLRLPELGQGESLETATFRLQLASFSGAPTAFNLDLYGMSRIADAPTLLASDFYAGPLDASATLIQDDMMTAATPVRSGTGTANEFVFSSTEANARLLEFLKTSYADGANAGKYVFLRLSPDIATMPVGNNAYNLVSGDAAQEKERPQIIYTTTVVPEPIAMSALVTGCGGLMLMRRRHGNA